MKSDCPARLTFHINDSKYTQMRYGLLLILWDSYMLRFKPEQSWIGTLYCPPILSPFQIHVSIYHLEGHRMKFVDYHSNLGILLDNMRWNFMDTVAILFLGRCGICLRRLHAKILISCLNCMSPTFALVRITRRASILKTFDYWNLSNI